jgi:hypothetical protein
MALGSTQPLTEMSTRNLSGGKGWPARGWQPHCHLWADYLQNVGASRSHNHMGLQGLFQGELYLFFFYRSQMNSVHTSSTLLLSRSILIYYITSENQGSRVRFLAGARDLYLLHSVQTGSGAHPASYPMGTGGSFLGGKAVTSHPHPMACMCWYTSSPLSNYTVWCLIKHRVFAITFYLYYIQGTYTDGHIVFPKEYLKELQQKSCHWLTVPYPMVYCSWLWLTRLVVEQQLLTCGHHCCGPTYCS